MVLLVVHSTYMDMDPSKPCNFRSVPIHVRQQSACVRRSKELKHKSDRVSGNNGTGL